MPGASGGGGTLVFPLSLVGKGRNGVAFSLDCFTRVDCLCLAGFLISSPQGGGGEVGAVFLSIPGIVFVIISS